MRPLASPVLEYRVLGVVAVVGGVTCGVVGLAVDGAAVATERFVFFGASFAAVMYPFGYRRFLRRAIEDLQASPNADREATSRTVRRALLFGVAELLVVAFLALLFHEPTMAGGFLAGNGLALLAGAQWLAQWQRRRNVRVLREPRFRWSTEGRRGAARGIMAPQDFYLDRAEAGRDLSPRATALGSSGRPG